MTLLILALQGSVALTASERNVTIILNQTVNFLDRLDLKKEINSEACSYFAASLKYLNAKKKYLSAKSSLLSSKRRPSARNTGNKRNISKLKRNLEEYMIQKIKVKKKFKNCLQ